MLCSQFFKQSSIVVAAHQYILEALLCPYYLLHSLFKLILLNFTLNARKIIQAHTLRWQK